MELKNSIKKYRQVKGFTQEELALKSGVSRQTIISIERYRYKPSLELGLKISLALETDINKLFFLDFKQEETIKSKERKESKKKPNKFQSLKSKRLEEIMGKFEKK